MLLSEVWINRRIAIRYNNYMNEGESELESRIDVGRSQPVHKRPGLIERLRQRIVEGQIRIKDSGLPIEEPSVRSHIALTAETNLAASKIFVDNLRRKTPEIMRQRFNSEPTHPSYTNNEEYSGPDLSRIADSWMLPALLLLKGGRHWVLALKEPEREASGWRALIYDPLIGHEDWMRLENWITDYSDPDNIIRCGGYTGAEGLRALQRGTYNLSLEGDRELADQADLLTAKQARTQFNSWDCGPLCLFAAALREGVKTGQNEFKFIGRDILLRDTGVRILTREEISGTNPSEP